MKIFIISPNVDTLFNQEQQEALAKAGESVFIKDIKPLDQVTELYEGDEPRIVAVDPDFSDFHLPNDVIDAIPNLKAICLQTTGFNWMDTEHAKAKRRCGYQLTRLFIDCCC